MTDVVLQHNWSVSAVFGAGTVCVMVLARRFHAVSLERVSYLSVLLAVYPFFVFRWSREHTWKWLLVIVMALGLLAIALVVPGDIVESFRYVALFVGLVWVRSGYSVFVHPAHPTTLPGNGMNDQLRAISELDRVIHEPGRLMITALLAAVKECDFLYLLHETELNKGNLSGP